MKVTIRLKDDLTAEIDRIAAGNGQTRSSWIVTALVRAVVMLENDELPGSRVKGMGHPDDQVRVTVRLNRSEIDAIDAVGHPLGLTRNEWIKRTLRWQLWDRSAVLRLAPVTQVELGKLRKQVLLIGRNINQAVHAMNAATMLESSLDLGRIAGPFLDTCAELMGLLFATRRALSSLIGAEVGYWTENHGGRS